MRDAFVAKILEIEPTFESLSAIRWNYVPGGRKNGRAVVPVGTRNFDLIFGAAVPSYLWTGGSGNAYQVRVAVATIYAGVPMDQIEHVLIEDSVDLRHALNQLRDPTLPGLADAKALGIQNLSIDNQANMYVEHVFEIQYHQHTR
jgi:hypothetical protein